MLTSWNALARNYRGDFDFAALKEMLEGQRVILGGGFISRLVAGRSIMTGDIDCFFRNEDDFKRMERRLVVAGYRVVIRNVAYMTGFAKTYAGPLGRHPRVVFQLIYHEYFESSEDLINAFDFTVCQAACKEGFVVLGEETAADIETWTIRPTDSFRKTGPDAYRVSKYLRRGFVPAELDETIEKSLEEQLSWVTRPIWPFRTTWAENRGFA